MLTEFSNHPRSVDYPYNQYRAICKEVIDGDTMTMLVDLGFYCTKHIRVRVLGIDTPELRSPDMAEREQAQKAKQRAMELLLDKPCIVRTFKDKQTFDRWVADVYYFSDSDEVILFSDTMLIEGLATTFVK